MYWPGMTAQIKDHIQHCGACAENARSLPKETWAADDLPSRPWQIVGAELFHFNDRMYLITVDYFSSFLEIDPLTSTTSLAVIYKLKAHFARHRTPEKLPTDNGLQFSSGLFQDFSRTWGFRHPARNTPNQMAKLRTP